MNRIYTQGKFIVWSSWTSGVFGSIGHGCIWTLIFCFFGSESFSWFKILEFPINFGSNWVFSTYFLRNHFIFWAFIAKLLISWQINHFLNKIIIFIASSTLLWQIGTKLLLQVPKIRKKRTSAYTFSLCLLKTAHYVLYALFTVLNVDVLQLGVKFIIMFDIYKCFSFVCFFFSIFTVWKMMAFHMLLIEISTKQQFHSYFFFIYFIVT